MSNVTMVPKIEKQHIQVNQELLDFSGNIGGMSGMSSVSMETCIFKALKTRVVRHAYFSMPTRVSRDAS